MFFGFCLRFLEAFDASLEILDDDAVALVLTITWRRRLLRFEEIFDLPLHERLHVHLRCVSQALELLFHFLDSVGDENLARVLEASHGKLSKLVAEELAGHKEWSDFFRFEFHGFPLSVPTAGP